MTLSAALALLAAPAAAMLLGLVLLAARSAENLAERREYRLRMRREHGDRPRP